MFPFEFEQLISQMQGHALIYLINDSLASCGFSYPFCGDVAALTFELYILIVVAKVSGQSVCSCKKGWFDEQI